MTVLCLHPPGHRPFSGEYRDVFKPGSLVTDVCGVKTSIMAGAEILPEWRGLHRLPPHGGHRVFRH